MFFARAKGLSADEIRECLTKIYDEKLDYVTGKQVLDNAKERRYACGVFSLLLYQIRALMFDHVYRSVLQTEPAHGQEGQSISA